MLSRGDGGGGGGKDGIKIAEELVSINRCRGARTLHA